MNGLIYSVVLSLTFFTRMSDAQTVLVQNVTESVDVENTTQQMNVSSSTVGLSMMLILNEAGLDVHRLMSDCERNESIQNQTMEELSALNYTLIMEALDSNDTDAVMDIISDLIDSSPFLQEYATTKAVVAKISSLSSLLNRFGVDYNHLISAVRENHEIGKKVLQELSPFNQTTIRAALTTDEQGLVTSLLIGKYIQNSVLLMSYAQPQENQASTLTTVSTILLLPVTLLVNNMYSYLGNFGLYVPRLC